MRSRHSIYTGIEQLISGDVRQRLASVRPMVLALLEQEAEMNENCIPSPLFQNLYFAAQHASHGEFVRQCWVTYKIIRGKGKYNE